MNTVNHYPAQQNSDQDIKPTKESTIPEHPQPNQPQSEAERQQQLQNAHLENQDAKVKLPHQQQANKPEHKEIGSMHNSDNA